MPSSHPQPSVVLVRPQMGENIGAAARGMWNFGLDRMRVVAPAMDGPVKRPLPWPVGQGACWMRQGILIGSKMRW